MRRDGRIKLECGHWSVRFRSIAEMNAAYKDGTALCGVGGKKWVSCGDQPVTNVYEVDDTKALMDGTGISVHVPRPAPVRSRPDGLTIRHMPNGRKKWWCRRCSKQSRAVSEESLAHVFAAWDAHKETPMHLRVVREKALLGDLFDAMSSG